MSLLTSHSIVGKPLTELIDHDEEYAEGIATALHLLAEQKNCQTIKMCVEQKMLRYILVPTLGD